MNSTTTTAAARARRLVSSSMHACVSTVAAATTVHTVQTSPYAQTHTSTDVINFGIGQPSPSLLPLALFQRAAQHRLQDGQDPALFQYGAARGYDAFRRDLAAYLSTKQAMPIDADALAITAGNSQALSHAALVLTQRQRNKRVVVEAPTYFLAFHIFRELGLDISAVPVDAHGLDIDALEAQLQAGDVPAFVYTIPFFHNPTGAVVSTARITKLLALAALYDFYIVSDEPYNLLSFASSSQALPSLASLDVSGGRVVSLGSFSKILAPGLRLGWVQSSSSDVLTSLASVGAIRSGGGQSPLTAGLVHSVLQLNLLEPHVTMLQRVFEARKTALCDALQSLLCPDCSFREPQGGYFVWLALPDSVDAEQLLRFAVAHHGVAFTPGARCVVPEEDVVGNVNVRHCVRLSFAFYDSDELVLGVERLRTALRAYR